MAEVEFGGVKFTGGKMFAVITALSTLGGAAWGSFEVYKDYMDMKEIVQNIDVDAIAAENNLVVQKIDESMLRVEEAIEYARDIKNDLRKDVSEMEAHADRTEDKVEISENRIKDAQNLIETHLETIRDEMNDLRKEVTVTIREIEKTIRESEKDVRDTMRTTENRIDDDMRKLDKDINERVEEALDNPLND
jgi:hypothetical protein